MPILTKEVSEAIAVAILTNIDTPRLSEKCGQSRWDGRRPSADALVLTQCNVAFPNTIGKTLATRLPLPMGCPPPIIWLPDVGPGPASTLTASELGSTVGVVQTSLGAVPGGPEGGSGGKGAGGAGAGGGFGLGGIWHGACPGNEQAGPSQDLPLFAFVLHLCARQNVCACGGVHPKPRPDRMPYQSAQPWQVQLNSLQLQGVATARS